MALMIRKLLQNKKKQPIKKDSITGRNNSFPVPYLSKLEGKHLQLGQSLIFHGIIIGRKEFIINLTNGSEVVLNKETTQLDNCFFCLRVNLEKPRKIYINTCDKKRSRKFAVKHKWSLDDEFDIRIRFSENEFEIFANYKLIAKLPFSIYSMPLNNISHIYINGDIELNLVSWEGNFYKIPYLVDIFGNFYPGQKLHVSGLAKKNAKKFVLKLYDGKSNIALQITNTKFSLKKMLSNSKVNNNFVENVNLSYEYFPLKKNQTFDISIYCEDTIFLIYVYDWLVASYYHRINPCSIDKLFIEGDIILHSVFFK